MAYGGFINGRRRCTLEESSAICDDHTYIHTYTYVSNVFRRQESIHEMLKHFTSRTNDDLPRSEV